MVIELTGDNLSQYIGESKLVVFFKTDWCGICKDAFKYLKEISVRLNPKKRKMLKE